MIGPGGLFACGGELRRYFRKGALELRAQRVHHCDDRDGNPSRDQGIFNGRGTGLVLKKPLENAHGPEFPIWRVQIARAAFAFANHSGCSAPII
jgi:hypothetical protein